MTRAKKPDIYIYQYKNGAFKTFRPPINMFISQPNHKCFIAKFGKIICAFKIYLK